MPLTEKDRKLVNDLLTGTPGAWTTFIDRYGNLIVQVIRHTANAHSLRLNDDDIDDLTADVFAAMLDRNMGAIRSFRGRSSFATYLTVVVRRVVLRKLTQRRFRQAFGHVEVHQASVKEAAADVDARDEVDSLMTRLPASLRRVMKAFYMEGRSYREISRLLNVPVNSIGPMISRARQLLQERHST